MEVSGGPIGSSRIYGWDIKHLFYDARAEFYHQHRLRMLVGLSVTTESELQNISVYPELDLNWDLRGGSYVVVKTLEDLIEIFRMSDLDVERDINIEYRLVYREFRRFLYKTSLRKIPLLLNSPKYRFLCEWRLKVGK